MQQKAIFLDRDGTLNKEVDNLRDVKQLRILSGVPQALKTLKKLGYLLIVVTNQPVIARGWLTHEGLKTIHDELAARLRKKGVELDKIYYCPHHPNANLKEYRKKCECRKPGIGMIRQAMRDFDISLKKSFVVGDSTRDIGMGKKAAIKTILLKTGYGGRDGMYEAEPDFVARDIKEALRIIKKHGV